MIKVKRPRREPVKIEDVLDDAKDMDQERAIKRMLKEGYIPMKESVEDILDRKYKRTIWVKPKIAM